MPNTTHKPVIFLTFANDRDDRVNYVRNLPEEARQIREPLQRARRDGLCELVELANATAEDIFRVFQDPEYRDRIAVFHYGGHPRLPVAAGIGLWQSICGGCRRIGRFFRPATGARSSSSTVVPLSNRSRDCWAPTCRR